MIAKDTKEKHKELVRQIITAQPRATLQQIKEKLESKNIITNIQYISTLRDKIRNERVVRYDTAKVNARLAEMQDRIEEVEKHLWEIILDTRLHLTGSDIGMPIVTTSAKIKAALAIIKAEKDLLDAQMDAGVFERKLGTFEANFNVKLEDKQRQKIIAALENYGILEVPCKELNNGDTNTTTTDSPNKI